MKQEHLEQVFSYLGDAIVMTDEHSNILYCNEAFNNLFEYEPEQIIGQKVSCLISPDASEPHEHSLYQYLNSDAPPKVMASRSTTMICYTRNGKAFPAKISISRLNAKNGKIGIAIVHDMSNLEREKEHLQSLARTDNLTSLLNRNYLDELIEDTAALQTNAKPMGVLFIDLNDFKQINDQHGHSIGDRILNITGLRIKNAVRDSDLAFRYGGDEFLIFAMNIESRENLLTLADKISESLARLLHIGDKNLYISCSIGTSLFPQDAMNINDAIHIADQTMYRNK